MIPAAIRRCPKNVECGLFAFNRVESSNAEHCSHTAALMQCSENFRFGKPVEDLMKKGTLVRGCSMLVHLPAVQRIEQIQIAASPELQVLRDGFLHLVSHVVGQTGNVRFEVANLDTSRNLCRCVPGRAKSSVTIQVTFPDRFRKQLL